MSEKVLDKKTIKMALKCTHNSIARYKEKCRGQNKHKLVVVHKDWNES